MPEVIWPICLLSFDNTGKGWPIPEQGFPSKIIPLKEDVREYLEIFVKMKLLPGKLEKMETLLDVILKLRI